MRTITMTAQQFRDFVYPGMASGTATNDAEFETAMRVMKKLKDPGLTTELALTLNEVAAQLDGVTVFPFRKLLESSVTFVLHEDEYVLLKGRITAMQPTINYAAGDAYQAVRTLFAGAKEVAEEQKA